MNAQFLPAINFAYNQQCQCQSILLALGSNHHAEKHLAYALQQLSLLGQLTVSTAYVNDDYRMATTKTTLPQYINQCVVINLNKNQNLADINLQCKLIEDNCLRDRSNKNIVTIDIDILAVQSDDNVQWHAINERYPFKDHEWVGIKELFT